MIVTRKKKIALGKENINKNITSIFTATDFYSVHPEINSV